MIRKHSAIATLATGIAFSPAHAAVTISTAATQNMNCSGGTCIPTATKAVLNAGDLQNYLSQFGNVRVMTTGNGMEANNIVVDAPFTSPDSTSLTLDAHRAITVNAAVSIGSGTAELELQSGKGGTFGTLSFGRKGHITFGSLSDIFGINGGIFTLVGSVQGLANAVAANPSGAYALANGYDASKDGTYSGSPVATTFSGFFEGLGNTISKLSVNDSAARDNVGLFAYLNIAGVLENLRLAKLQMKAAAPYYIGGLVGVSHGSLLGDSVTGKIRRRGSDTVLEAAAGGLVGFVEGKYGEGTIINSSADVALEAGQHAAGGGLVGWVDFGTVSLSHATGSTVGTSGGGLIGWGVGAVVDQCYATGAVTSVGRGAAAGGLLAQIDEGASITNSYATGSLSGREYAGVGGLVGTAATSGTGSSIGSSYSTGVPTGGRKTYVGGFLGLNDKKNGATMTHAYWDTTTSGTDVGVGQGSDAGLTGLTTEQLQSGLPAGFDPKIWNEDSSINNGLPYLIANPPPN